MMRKSARVVTVTKEDFTMYSGRKLTERSMYLSRHKSELIPSKRESLSGTSVKFNILTKEDEQFLLEPITLENVLSAIPTGSVNDIPAEPSLEH